MSVTNEHRGESVRFGAGSGSFLVASVIGVAFEARQDARILTNEFRTSPYLAGKPDNAAASLEQAIERYERRRCLTELETLE